MVEQKYKRGRERERKRDVSTMKFHRARNNGNQGKLTNLDF